MTREEAIAYGESKKARIKEKLIRVGSSYGDYAIYYSEMAFTSAALAALREQEERRWIPVSERLPEDGKKVVFFNYGADAVYAGKFNYIGKKGTVWFRAGKTSYPGSYWMPLPEPPKEDAT